MNCKLMFIFLLGAAGIAQADDVYKWTDTNGVVHYSDAAPPLDTANVQRVHVSGGVTKSTTPDNQTTDTGKEAEKPQQPATVSDTPENRAKLCERARSNLELLQSKTPLSVDKDGSGKPQALDDQARQAQIVNAQEQIAAYCK